MTKSFTDAMTSLETDLEKLVHANEAVVYGDGGAVPPISAPSVRLMARLAGMPGDQQCVPTSSRLLVQRDLAFNDLFDVYVMDDELAINVLQKTLLDFTSMYLSTGK